jgi:hypothetical protein
VHTLPFSRFYDIPAAVASEIVICCACGGTLFRGDALFDRLGYHAMHHCRACADRMAKRATPPLVPLILDPLLVAERIAGRGPIVGHARMSVSGMSAAMRRAQPAAEPESGADGPGGEGAAPEPNGEPVEPSS